MAGSPEESRPKKRSSSLNYVSGFLVSFALIFAGMYFYMTRFVVPRMQEQAALEMEQAAADSAASASEGGEQGQAAGTVHGAADSTASKTDVITSLKGDSSLAMSDPDRLLEAGGVEGELSGPRAKQEIDAEERRKRIRQLAKMYSAMKAQEAAVIVAKLDDETITAILLQMRDREAGKILAALAALEPDRAAQVIRQMVQ